MGRDAALLTQGVGSCIGGCAAALRTTGNTVVVLVGLAVVRARDVVAASDTAQVGVITCMSVSMLVYIYHRQGRWKSYPHLAAQEASGEREAVVVGATAVVSWAAARTSREERAMRLSFISNS